MKAQTSHPATAQEQFVRRVVAAIEARATGSAGRRRGRYGQGAERLPDSTRNLRIGRFSTGGEQRPDAPGTSRRGSFADGYGG